MGWIIFAVIVIPLVAVFAWLLLDESFVRIEPGNLGLLLLKGRPTDRTLGPGVHWVPALRRRTVEVYPSVELSLRADGAVAGEPDATLERTSPPAHVCLADRTRGIVSYTLRFRLDVDRLQVVHTRFGVDGYWSATRDISATTVVAQLATTEVDALFGERRVALDATLQDALAAELGPVGVIVTMFRLTDADLGQTSAVMEATARARHELDREQAESGMRMARAQNDANLAPFAGAGTDVALRYREVDSLRELARSANVIVPVPARPAADQPADAEPAAVDEA